MAHATADAIQVKIVFLARYAELVGRDAITLSLAATATVGDAVAELRRTLPNGADLPARPLCAVNHAHVLPSATLADGDEMALLPPVAGG